jgi:hypothetical protein
MPKGNGKSCTSARIKALRSSTAESGTGTARELVFHLSTSWTKAATSATRMAMCKQTCARDWTAPKTHGATTQTDINIQNASVEP